MGCEEKSRTLESSCRYIYKLGAQNSVLYLLWLMQNHNKRKICENALIKTDDKYIMYS